MHISSRRYLDFNRANWCPGESVSTFRHDITNEIIPGNPATFDIDFTDFSPMNNNAQYMCALQFFEFSGANFSLNAEVLDIISALKIFIVVSIYLWKSKNCN